MKIYFQNALPPLLLSVCLLPLLLASDRPSDGEDNGTKPSPLSGYRFVPDRAFDLLSSEEAEPAPPEPVEAEPEIPVPVAPPPPVVPVNEPADFEELFPTIVEDTPPAPAEAPVEPDPPSRTPVESVLPLIEETPPVERPTPPPDDPDVPEPDPDAAPPPVATDDPRPEEALPALTGPREAPPRPGEELTFPLTLEIPEPPPDERPPEGGASAPRSETAPATGGGGRDGTSPVFPVLKGSAPAVVGIGATLGDNSDIYLDALVPFWQTGNDAYRTIFFLAPRITGTEEETNSGSLGLGIRSLRGEGALSGKSFPWIIGANVFYDFTRSSNDFDYNQFGAGIEWMSPLVDLRVNAYFPDGGRNQVAETSSTSSTTSTSTTSRTTFGQPFPTGHTVVQPFTVRNTTQFRRTTTTRFFEKHEEALQGFDGEAGLLLPADLTFIPVRVYGGYYSFDNPFGSDITGPKARVEARPFSFLLLDASWYQDEELLGSNWFLGARASVRIGGGRTPPSSSKPLHDTKAGPKEAAYNPYGDFHRRLLERIPRNYRAVLVESPFLENAARRQSRTSTSSRTSTTTGTEIIASDIVFVDGSRGGGGAGGTWEAPRNTIQGGADLAVARLGSTGRIWTVWTQGGAGPYSESVTVTDSVRFISNAVAIAGKDGFSFGGLTPEPVVQGGFLFGTLPASPAPPRIPVGSVRGYSITGGHAAAGFTGVTFVNVGQATASNNRIDTVGGSGIAVIQRGDTSSTGTFASNQISNTLGHAVHFDLADTASGNHSVTDSTFRDIGGNGVRVDATDSATHDISLARSSASGLSESALFLQADANTSGSLGAANSIFDGGGADTALSGNARATLTVSGSRFVNDPGPVFDLTLSDSARQVADLRNNVLDQNQSALGLEVTGAAVSETTFAGNAVSNSTADAVVAGFSGTGAQTFTASGNEFSATDGTAVFVSATGGTADVSVANNTIDTAIDNGIHLLSTGAATVTALVTGNGVSNSSAGSALIRATVGGNLTATVSNNVFETSGTHGLRVQSVDDANLSAVIQGNTVRQTLAAGIELLARNNSLLAVLAQANSVSDTGSTGIGADADGGSLLNLTAEGNNISDTTSEGILISGRDNSSSRFEARGNTISTSRNASGIRSSFLDAHATVVRIANNRIGPVARQGVEIATSDDSMADIEVTGNLLADTARDGIRMTLFSTENQSALVRGNRLQRTGANAVNATTQGGKGVTVFDNTIGTTGGAAVRVDMQSGGLVLGGESDGDNLYTDLTPLPFDNAGLPPAGAGIRINGIVYP